MTSVADITGIRFARKSRRNIGHLDLARAGSFSLVRLGFPRIRRRGDTGTSTAKMHRFAATRVAMEFSICAEGPSQ
jgi:hypothetical protein